ncbi:MAG TPA: hypothetical protein VL133_11355 [Devosia sp.]|nr:hypothetical protein [Devosia sp.]
MTGIYWGKGEARIVDYSALTKPGKTIITVKIEVSDHFALGHMLDSLERDREDRRRAARPAKARRPLLLTDQRGRSE